MVMILICLLLLTGCTTTKTVNATYINNDYRTVLEAHSLGNVLVVDDSNLNQEIIKRVELLISNEENEVNWSSKKANEVLGLNGKIELSENDFYCANNTKRGNKPKIIIYYVNNKTTKIVYVKNTLKMTIINVSILDANSLTECMKLIDALEDRIHSVNVSLVKNKIVNTTSNVSNTVLRTGPDSSLISDRQYYTTYFENLKNAMISEYNISVLSDSKKDLEFALNQLYDVVFTEYISIKVSNGFTGLKLLRE